LGPGIQATELTDDCLGRALDWLYAHDPTQLFAGIATQARKTFHALLEMAKGEGLASSHAVSCFKKSEV
jgi:hypothetical protein